MIRQTMVAALALGAFVYTAEAQPGKRVAPAAEEGTSGVERERRARPEPTPGARPAPAAGAQAAPAAGAQAAPAAGAQAAPGAVAGAQRRPAPAPSQARRRGPPKDTPVVSGFAPRSGPPGTEVTIRGRNLDAPGLEVVVGGEVVKPTRSSARALTIMLPKGVEGGSIALRRSQRPEVVVGAFEASKKRSKRRAKRDEAHRKQAQAQWEARRKELPESEDERLAELDRQEDGLRRSREERRRQRAAALAAAHDRQLRAKADVQAELALNAERIARLDRMLRLAEAQADGRLVVRVRVLQQQEAERHEQRINDLRLAFGSR
jgi:hypothetical protein